MDHSMKQPLRQSMLMLLGVIQADSETYMTEMDSIHLAYEEMLGQNNRLLQQLSQRDEANNALLSERIKGTQTAMKLAEERDAAVAAHRQSQDASQSLQASLCDLERRLQVLKGIVMSPSISDMTGSVSLQVILSGSLQVMSRVSTSQSVVLHTGEPLTK